MMTSSEVIGAAAFGVGLLLAVSVVALSAVQIRRAPDDRSVRFTYGWLATLATWIGLACGVWLVGVLATSDSVSRLALTGIVAVNLLLQPVAVMFIVVGAAKLFHGLRGNVAVAWRRVSDEELANMTPMERRSHSRYCAAGGVVLLALGLLFSYSLAWPLFSQL
jgi:hypothetical protein